jgi:DNA-binding MarR family transcriptional regulator
VDVTDRPLLEPEDDIALLCQVLASATSERVLRELAAAGFTDVRASHGYVFQGVLAGDTTVTQLAHRLGVSAQAVSKSVAELERAGYLERRPHEHDGRTRLLTLTDRGRAMLATSRRARRAVADEITEQLGARDARTLLRLLRAVSERYGGLETISARTVRPIE